MIKMKRNKEQLNFIIDNFLRRNDIYYECAPWCIKESPFGGFGVFATRDIEPGEFIFHDHPVILGPRFLPNIPEMCVACYRWVNILV